MKLKLTIGATVLTATLYDNATAQDFAARLPLTLSMQNLYERELVYRFPQALACQDAQTSGYVVGDIAYWTPRHSFVIFYGQNGEVIPHLQMVGRIESGVERLSQMGDASVTFERIAD